MSCLRTFEFRKSLCTSVLLSIAEVKIVTFFVQFGCASGSLHCGKLNSSLVSYSGVYKWQLSKHRNEADLSLSVVSLGLWFMRVDFWMLSFKIDLDDLNDKLSKTFNRCKIKSMKMTLDFWSLPENNSSNNVHIKRHKLVYLANLTTSKYTKKVNVMLIPRHKFVVCSIKPKEANSHIACRIVSRMTQNQVSESSMVQHEVLSWVMKPHFQATWCHLLLSMRRESLTILFSMVTTGFLIVVVAVASASLDQGNNYYYTINSK